MTTNTRPMIAQLDNVHLIYVDDEGNEYPQPAGDVVESGNLDVAEDPNTGEQVDLTLSHCEVFAVSSRPLT